MLKKLFGLGSSKDPKPGPQLCMPALATTTGPSPKDIAEAWKDLFPAESELQVGSTDDSVTSFTIDGMMLMAAHMPMPIPAGDIESACDFSWMFPKAEEAMKRQKSHLIITALRGKESGPDPIAEAMLVTRAAAAVCRASDAAGVYWGNGCQVHEPEFFIDAAKDFDGLLPCMLWVGHAMSGESKEGPFTITTHGMRCFGHKELEIIDTTMPAGDLRGTVYDIVSYLLKTGPVFKHGQSFGPTAEDKWRIEHTTSQFRKGEAVVRLHIP